MAQAVEGCLRHGITAIAPWRDQVAAIGLDAAARLVRDNGLRVTGLCRGGFFPAATRGGPRGGDRRQPPGDRRGGGARGGLPGARRRRAAGRIAGHRARRARWSATAWRRCCRTPGRRWRAARHRAAASGLCRGPRLREHAGAGARSLRRARRRDGGGDRRLPRLVGSRAGAAAGAGRGGRADPRASHLRLAGPDPRPAERPGHDGRRGRRPEADPRAGSRRPGSTGRRRSRSSPRRTGGSGTATRCCGPASSGSGRPAEPNASKRANYNYQIDMYQEKIADRCWRQVADRFARGRAATMHSLRATQVRLETCLAGACS